MTKLQLQVSTDHSLSQTSVLKYGPNFRLQILTEYWPNPSLEILNNYQCQNLHKSVANTNLITNISNNNNTNKYWVGIFTIQGWQSSLNNISEWVTDKGSQCIIGISPLKNYTRDICPLVPIFQGNSFRPANDKDRQWRWPVSSQMKVKTLQELRKLPSQVKSSLDVSLSCPVLTKKYWPGIWSFVGFVTVHIGWQSHLVI